MKISILMPTYDCPPDLLLKAVNSVLNQTHQDFEIIIKDGNPVRPSIQNPEIRALIRDRKDVIRYTASYDGPPASESGAFGHNGFYEALNFCVEQATGEIFTLLCSDDERGLEDTLTHVNERFEQHGPGPFCLYGACEWIDRLSTHVCFKCPPHPVTFETILRDYPFYTPALFWNRAVHNKFGLFDNKNYFWCADLDFWLRVWRGIDSEFTQRIIGRYRVWETSQARTNCELLGAEGSAIIRSHSA